MKLKLITLLTCLFTMLIITSHGYASNPVKIIDGGIQFSDGSVQQKSASLPGCSNGGVLIYNSTGNSSGWFCGTVMPVTNGIVTCTNSVCAVSACLTGFDNCDGVVVNGCEAALSTEQNCGACGNTCAVDNICSAGACVPVPNPNKPGAVVLSTSSTPGATNGNVPVTLTATVTPVGPQGTLPNGTPVTFTILSGTGTLTGGVQTAVANTTNGVASVVLNSTVVGSVVVHASAGTSPVVTSNSISVPFILQPTQAIVTVALTGTGSIGGSTIVVDNVSNQGLGIPTVKKIGVGIDANIFAANTSVSNKVTIGYAWSPGTPAGTVATITYPISAGKFPQVSDFSVNVAGTTIIDDNNQPLPTVTATISVSIQ